ncbi:hypothetical protein Bca52824_042356 [Brassica carinata]|uniref:Uncharacterized protein n=1 Tax=Brassica carinata TaxID=52824 RepID=A0A8X7RX84_BRACI|nr:hypothetical protein Bca52824_042356 [Brassica carinata]
MIYWIIRRRKEGLSDGRAPSRHSDLLFHKTDYGTLSTPEINSHGEEYDTLIISSLDWTAPWLIAPGQSHSQWAGVCISDMKGLTTDQ